jgi:hypothetical protein
MTRVLLCRELTREHHYYLICDRPSVVVYRSTLTEQLHPRCERHWTAELRSQAGRSGWVEVPRAVAA